MLRVVILFDIQNRVLLFKLRLGSLVFFEEISFIPIPIWLFFWYLFYFIFNLYNKVINY